MSHWFAEPSHRSVSRIAITMPWTPNLSVGHYLDRRAGGGYFTRPEVKAWKTELTFRVRNQTHLRGLTPKPPITIAVRAFYPDRRSITDGDNLGKVINDSVEDAWIRPDGRGPLINDREFSFIFRGYALDAENPRLEITIEWAGGQALKEGQ